MKLLPPFPRRSKARAKRQQAAFVPVRRTLAPEAALPAIPLPGNLRQRLNALRRRHRLTGLMTGLAMVLTALSLLFLVQGVSDWWFDLPWFARVGFLLADLAVLGAIYRRHLHRALRKRLSLAEAALMVEKKWPRVQQSVIAAVQLCEGKALSTRGSPQLVRLALEQARARTTNLNFSEVVPTRRAWRWWMAAVAALLVAGGVAAFTWPASLVLLERIFLVNVPLPTKTIVVPITGDLEVPVGSDVELSAKAQGIIPTHGSITLTYATGPAQEFPVDAVPDKPGTFSFTLHNVQNAFKYRFVLNDGHGPEFTVTAKVPPSLSGVECEQVFPGYTGISPRKLAPTDLSLLAGSHLQVRATSTDPLKSAKVVLQGLTQTVDATLDSSGTHLEADIPIPAKNLTGFSIHLVEPSGVASANETVYSIVIVPDNPPVVKILEPADDRETITLRAKPPIVFEASDDYGLTSVTLNYQLIPPMIAGEQDARPPSAVQTIPIKIKPAPQGTQYAYVLDVAAQIPPWQEGYAVNFWIEAKDNNTATGPGITQTDHKQFGVISLAAKQAEILERLKQNASDIGTLSTTQQKISEDVGEAIPQKK